MDLLEKIRTECIEKKIDIDELSKLMYSAGKKYLEQFSGEQRGANALALGAFIAGDIYPQKFAELSEKIKGKGNKNYFEFLWEEVSS